MSWNGFTAAVCEVKPGKSEWSVWCVVWRWATEVAASKPAGGERAQSDWCLSGSVHLEAGMEWCTEQGHEASPVYLSGHLRVLICVRLTASKEGRTESVIKREETQNGESGERESEQQELASREIREGKKGGGKAFCDRNSLNPCPVA